MRPRGMARGRALVLIAAAIAIGAAAALGPRLFRPKERVATAPTDVVERQDIVVTVEANGAVEPVNVVEVKSKASGQIIEMPVEIGSVVAPGDLLAQIDTRDVKNQFDQSKAALEAAQARVSVSESQKKRADELLAQQIITAQEHESALLENANAQSQLVAARTNLDIARQRLEDATVRAPVAGTVIDKPVAVGQVISSATSSVSGGTVLLMMADLQRIRMRALVNETDIGNVKPGQPATVAIDAYPQRAFDGAVEKVEPRAVVEQSVTMFPVLVSIANEDGLLMPGMNGEVTLQVERRDDVLAVPVDAVRGVSELSAVAATLGLDVDSLRTAMRSRRGGGEGEGGGGDGEGAGRDSAGASERRGDPREGSKGGERSARANGGNGNGNANGGEGWRRINSGGESGRGSGGGSRGPGAAQFVVVKTPAGYAPRFVRIGITNYDYAEVLSGVTEGEEVVLLSAAQLQRSREENLERIRQRMGGGMGMRQQQPSNGSSSRGR
jgi:HlyD family secretion protein